MTIQTTHSAIFTKWSLCILLSSRTGYLLIVSTLVVIPFMEMRKETSSLDPAVHSVSFTANYFNILNHFVF